MRINEKMLTQHLAQSLAWGFSKVVAGDGDDGCKKGGRWAQAQHPFLVCYLVSQRRWRKGTWRLVCWMWRVCRPCATFKWRHVLCGWVLASGAQGQGLSRTQAVIWSSVHHCPTQTSVPFRPLQSASISITSTSIKEQLSTELEVCRRGKCYYRLAEIWSKSFTFLPTILSSLLFWPTVERNE